ncbi:glycosyltransferase [Amycolatopsis vastitatis]|uniref:Glycosyl transferase n=1 Tax=Amycolatopsis vastitatis TaxID=1905142 RepID=A0A229SPM2_9PSEU|nr:glycosyltransferase [Amycolatopsis vastitatis]OXM60611.1 glycosyl transferase [Amycolatopsis vastitatis]
MRVLLTGLPIRSHLMPVLVPLARAAREAGHEVAIATGAAVADDVERLGVPVVVLPDALAPGELGRRPDLLDRSLLSKLRHWRPEVTGPLAVPLFNDTMTAEFAANVVDAAWHPDVIVRETNEYGGYLAAEVLGVPSAVVDIAPLLPRLVPDLGARLDVLRGGFGLPPSGSVTATLTAGLLPEPWYPAELRTPGHRYHRVPEPAVAPAEAGPVVLAAFGSNVPSLLAPDSELLAITVEALGALGVRAVVALGSDEAVASWTGPRPENVELAGFVPQRALLAASDVFLTHAGFSGVREALSAGVPMVAVPLFADQPANAGRVRELGAGFRVDAAGLTPERLADAVSRVLGEPSYRSAARGLRRRIGELRPITDFVADLEGLT